jgi:hypothetical protein
VRLNHSPNPPPGFKRQSRPASSVASSRTRELRTTQNEAARIAHLAQSRIDEEERDLDEQEVAVAAQQMLEAARIAVDNALIAAKAKTDGARVRRELERRRFEVEATLSESLAQIEDKNANDVVSSHGMDATSVSDWVGTTHGQTMETYDVPLIPGMESRVTSTQVSKPGIVSGVPVLAPIPYPFLTMKYHPLLQLIPYPFVQ